MRICMTYNNGICRNVSAGFTLLELLVVLMILGLSLGTLLSSGLGKAADDQAQQVDAFASEFRLMAQSSVLQGFTHGLDFYLAEDGTTLQWHWLVLDKGKWVAVREISNKALQAGALGFTGSRAELRIDGLPASMQKPALLPDDISVASLPPALRLYPTRETTPFELVISNRAGHVDRIRVDLLGRIGINEDNSPPP
jgi:prepilin-type N-terminal cleavage/methylation domain-containing protein